MKRLLLPFTLLAAVPLFFGASLLRGASDDCCEVECRRCGETFCHPVPKEVTVSRHCWEVEWKQVCIPGVQWPWERWFSRCDGCDGHGCNTCATARCGRTRWVRVLKKKNYDCTKCGCDWVVGPLCDTCTAATPVPADVATPVAPVVPPAASNPPPLNRGAISLPSLNR